MRILGIAMLVLLAGASARADTLLLQDGRVLVGPPVEKTTDGVVVHFENGDVQVSKRDVVARYDEDDPEADLQRKAHLRHRLWRNRHKEASEHFLFETTMSRPVFHLYRDRMLAYYRALIAELGVEVAEDASLKVCLYGDEQDFRQIGGASAGVVAYYGWVLREINGFDDPTKRGTCIRGLQWATASYVVGLAFPQLPRKHPLAQGLTDYYAAAMPVPGDPARFTFGLAVGELCETLTIRGAGGVERCLEDCADEDRWRRNACAWAMVHFAMQDEAGKVALLERLRSFTPSAPPALPELLGLESEEAQERHAAALKAHVAGLRLTTVPDLLGAARVADNHISAGLVKDLHERAVALAPDDLEARFALASCLEDLQRYAAAAEAWRAVLALSPLHVKARENLARCLGRSDDAERSEREAKLAREIRTGFEAAHKR